VPSNREPWGVEMKHWLAALAIALGALAMVASEASAWVCTAASRTGSYGWGRHPTSLAYARRRALVECAARTPRRYTCYITGCR
jgi:hypothetical protein